LHRVIHLLKVATAATAKIWARRLNAMWGSSDYFFYRSEGDVSFYALDANPYTIARCGQGYHYRAAVGMRQTKSARQNAFDSYFHGFDKLSLVALLSNEVSTTCVSGWSEQSNRQMNV
jgi:hypothetical protein